MILKMLCTTREYILCQILKNVLVSASEAELDAIFENAQMGAIFRVAFWYLGHKKPPTPLKTKNKTTAGIVHNTFKKVIPITVDMRFHWIQDRSNMGNFYVYWEKGEKTTENSTRSIILHNIM